MITLGASDRDYLLNAGEIVLCIGEYDVTVKADRKGEEFGVKVAIAPRKPVRK